MVKTGIPLRLIDDGAGVLRLPTVDEIRTSMGGTDRRYWLLAALRFVGRSASLQDAEDALHDFLTARVPRVLQRYQREKGEIGPYFLKSFKFFCWGRIRTAAARPPHVPVETESGEGTVEIRIADESSLDPLVRLEMRDAASVLQMALVELPEMQLRAWKAECVDNLPRAEAAAQLKLSESAFGANLCRARQRINELTQLYGISMLSVRHVNDWDGLAKHLLKDAARDTPSIGKRLWTLGTNELHSLLSAGSLNQAEQQAAFIRELNAVLGRSDFYSAGEIGEVSFGENVKEIRSLLRRRNGPISNRRLNRLLFDHQYRRFVAN